MYNVKHDNYYDSSYTSLSTEAEKIIFKLLPTTTYKIDIEIMKMTKQVGSSDCGLYALAVATALAFRIDPTAITFNQDDMRSHLSECFEKQTISLFPIKKKCRVVNNVFKKITIFMCPTCVMPDNGSEIMVQCDSCDRWYHNSCVPKYDPHTEWNCPACLH